MAESTIKSQLAAEITSLRDAAAKSTDPCITAKFIAISDSKVQEHLLRHLEQKERLLSVECVPLMIPEDRGVLFTFSCPDRMICIVAPRMFVTVDFISGKVVHITDPYLGNPSASAFSGVGELPLALDQPSEADSLAVPASALAGAQAAEHAYLSSHGLNANLGGGVTPYATNLTSPTNSYIDTPLRIPTGGPFNPDFRVLHRVDRHTDHTADHIIDRRLDPIPTWRETGTIDDPNLTIREIGTIPDIDPTLTRQEGSSINVGDIGDPAGRGGVNINLGGHR